MSKYSIPGDVAEALKYEDEVETYRVVHRDTVGQRRWVSEEVVVFSNPEGQFFLLEFEEPLTEIQAEIQERWTAEDDIALKVVFPVEKTVVVYE